MRDEEANPEFILEQRQHESAIVVDPPPVPELVQTGLTQEEAKVLELIHGKERKTSIFAVALGISHISFEEQKKEVKRVKDRLKKRLERARSSNG